MPRLLLWCCAVALTAAPFVQTAAAAGGSSRVVLNVTARVVAACSVAAPAPESGGSGTDIDHRCTSAVPYRVSTRSLDPALDPVAAPGGGRVSVAPDPAAGDTLVVTVTY